MGYIRIPKVYEKLKRAEEVYAPVIMTAANGWGKSAAVEYYYRRKSCIVLRCLNGNLTEMPSPESFRSNVVIIEDMQWLSEEKSIRYLRNLLKQAGIQVVMLTRGAVPKYLASESINYGCICIREEDFVFGNNEVKAFFADRGIEICGEDIPLVTEASEGYPIALYYYAAHMEHGERYSERIREEVLQDLFHYWDGFIFDQWTEEFKTLVLSVCPYESFSIPMAEYLTGNKRVGEVIEYCRDKTNQLRYMEGGNYSIRPEMHRYYLWKRDLTWSLEEINENYRRAANYYEMHDDIPNALKYYRKAGAIQRVKELLIRNANTHPGIGHYVETKEYYFELPEEELKGSPVLMAGMCMLYDLLMMPEKAEEWYNTLLLFYQDKTNSRERCREARTWLAYLDIGLPHRGAGKKLEIFKNVFVLTQRGEVVLPELAVTGNLPSIMNGGLDFCEWSKNDYQIAKFMANPLTTLLGKFGNGLITLALAESGFEKKSMPAYEVLTRCNDGFAAAAYGGRIEMCFASVGIQVRQHLVEGQLPSAKRTSESFIRKAWAENAKHLFNNLAAFEIWLSLFTGSDNDLDRFLEAVPDAKSSFCILDRYRQMIRLRCLIAKDRLDEAFDLALFLTGYLKAYHRTFLWIENELLKSVILYRKNDPHWTTHLHEAVKKASEYHFVRIISLEGAAILPLLKSIKDDDGFGDIDGEFLTQTYEECFNVAASYPDYLKYTPREEIALTNRETQVLSLLCSGLSMEEICTELKIGYDGLKKHNRNIYKKLGVKNRAEAERKASRLGLTYRGEA